jgi:L-ribulose-5-phosphate 3-epimerase
MHRSEPSLSRRELLAGGAAALAMATVRAGEPAPPPKRGFRIGACDWCLGRGDPSVFEVARQIGLDGVQVNMGGDGDGLKLRRGEVQKAYAETAKASGLQIASLAMGELNSVPLMSEPRAAIWLLDSIETARALGVQVILLAFFGRGELRIGDTANVDRVVGVFKEAAPRAEKAGVVLGFENYMSAEDNVRILDRVGSPALQVYYDVGNSTDKGYDILKEIRFLGSKRICELHAKDAGHLLGKGRIDFRKVREAADAIDLRCWIQIEAAAPNGLVPDYKANLEYLRGLFPREI